MSAVCMAVGALLLGVLHPASAVFLRVSPTQNASLANKTNAASPDDAVSAVMDMVGAMQANLKPHHASAPSTNASQHRAKLDVGFTGYEQNLTEALVAIMRKSTPEPQWTNASRDRLIANVTGNISACLKEKLKAMKQSVGKTWMALPEDETKNVYVNQLKANFVPVFADTLKTIVSHFGRSGNRVEAYLKQHKPMDSDELLAKSEQTFLDAVVSERCYGGEELLQLSLVELSEVTFVASPTNASAPTGNQTHKKLGKFCLPSPLEHLVSRLNDAQGLLSMTMRFEAGAMNLAQTSKTSQK